MGWIMPVNFNEGNIPLFQNFIPKVDPEYCPDVIDQKSHSKGRVFDRVDFLGSY